MNLPFWNTLAIIKDRKDTLSAWQFFFRDHFEAMRPLLLPCPGEYARSYLHPERGMLCLRRFEDRWAAFSDPEFCDDDEDTELTEADVLLYRLDLGALRDRLRAALGIDGPSSSVVPGIECLGTCTQGPKRRRVFWVQASDDAAAIVQGQAVIARVGTEGCAVVTSLGEAVDQMLAAAGVSGVGLNERVTPTPGGFAGGCGIVCRHLAPRDLPVLELKDHLDTRLDTLAERVVALNQENETLKQNLARVLAEFARRVDPTFLAWVFVILAAGSMRGAAKTLKMSKSALDRRLRQFAERGGVYAMLYSTLEIRRKGVGQEPIQKFNELFIEHQPQTEPPGPDLWREVMEGLEALNPENWRQVRDELLEVLRQE